MVAPDSLTDSSVERNSSKGDVVNGQEASSPSNGNENPKTEISVVTEEGITKQPSYVALACCISGYTTLGYDSKQRQGLRSRPVSPIRSEGVNQNVSYTSECRNFLSPVARDLTPKMQTQDKGVELLNGCSALHSPRHVANMTMVQESRSYTSKSLHVSESYSSYRNSSSTTCYSVSSSHTATSTVNGNESRLITPTKVTAVGGREIQVEQPISPSSFIVQRVERLYGPGALAQGFYTRRTTSNTTRKTIDNGTKETKTSVVTIEKSEDSLPVLKLLRPEFRAQLSVANRKCRNAPTAPDRTVVKEKENSSEKEPCDVVDATILQPKEIISPIKEVKDGHYFLNALDEQVKLLEDLASTTEEELKICTSEEGCGILRAVAGKARLLVAQKLNQFRGLCHNNIKQTSNDDFPTTNEDLAGFWDMVMIQVREVHNQFDEIKVLRNNNWQLPKENTGKGTNGCAKSSGRRPSQKKASTSSSTSKSANSARDEARKKLLEEKRKAMRESKQQNNDTVLIL